MRIFYSLELFLFSVLELIAGSCLGLGLIGSPLSLRWRGQHGWQFVQLLLVDTHVHTCWEVPLNVLQEYVSRGPSDMLHLSSSETYYVDNHRIDTKVRSR